jgi:hypothetical protein
MVPLGNDKTVSAPALFEFDVNKGAAKLPVAVVANHL